MTDPGGASEAEYRILDVVSTTEVKIESFLPFAPASGLDWDIYTQPLVKRHKAAFVILNNFLKYHMFSVEFDASLLSVLPSNLIADLQELVFVAKPSYTYLVLTPAAFLSASVL